MRKFHCRVYGFVCLKGTDEGENPLYRKYLSLFKNKNQKVNVVKMENDIQIRKQSYFCGVSLRGSLISFNILYK